MFEKDIVTQSIIDAVNSVLNIDEKINVKKRTTDTLAGRVKIPPAAGDNQHSSYKVELNAEEVEQVDEVLDTYKGIKSYLDKSAVKRSALRDAPENKIAHPDYDKTANKIRKSFADSDKAINKWNKKNSFTKVELDEKIDIKSMSMGDIIKDFQTSDAPQFAGKSQAKRRQMAIAAKMATEEYLDEENAVDKVTMDVPLLIRIMEYSKEDAKSDMDLHKVAENLVEYSKSGKTLTMACYDEIVGGITEGIMKSLGRGLQGWSKGDKAITGTANSPRDIVIRNKGYDNETTKMLHKTSVSGSEHSPAGLQKRVLDREMKKRGIAEGKRPEDDSVPFITNEDDGLSKHVDSIKQLAKHTFKKVKANESYDEDPDVARADRELARMKAKPIKADRKTDPSKEMSKLSKRAPKEDADELDKDLTHKEEFELGESARSERKKSFVDMLNRVTNKAKENTKLEKNRKIEPKLPKKELAEAKKDSYQIYHPSYSSAVQHAEKHLNKQGYEIHPDDWFHHINAGPTKPAEGKTVSLHIPLHKDGAPTKKVAHIQVYNRGNDLANNHELNMYHN